MPRIQRGQQAGFVYHVINRGNGRATIFHKPQDYFGLRLFQTFQTACLSSIEGFNRSASFKALPQFKALRHFKVLRSNFNVIKNGSKWRSNRSSTKRRAHQIRIPFQSFNRFAPFITGIDPFQSFQTFNRFASVKLFQASAGSKRSKVPVYSDRSIKGNRTIAIACTGGL
jgi:hypothetical protein